MVAAVGRAAPQLIVMSVGGVAVGFEVSLTTTLNVQVGAPQAFVAVTTTDVVPLLKVSPLPVPPVEILVVAPLKV